MHNENNYAIFHTCSILSCLYVCVQGVTKGLVAEKVLSAMVTNGNAPDFLMCIGDDRSDEDMFESILSAVSSASLPAVPEIFACTVGQKPSKAKYYLDDTADVVQLLRGLGNASDTKPWDSEQFQVAFDTYSLMGNT